MPPFWPNPVLFLPTFGGTQSRPIRNPSLYPNTAPPPPPPIPPFGQEQAYNPQEDSFGLPALPEPSAGLYGQEQVFGHPPPDSPSGLYGAPTSPPSFTPYMAGPPPEIDIPEGYTISPDFLQDTMNLPPQAPLPEIRLAPQSYEHARVGGVYDPVKETAIQNQNREQFREYRRETFLGAKPTGRQVPKIRGAIRKALPEALPDWMKGLVHPLDVAKETVQQELGGEHLEYGDQYEGGIPIAKRTTEDYRIADRMAKLEDRGANPERPHYGPIPFETRALDQEYSVLRDRLKKREAEYHLADWEKEALKTAAIAASVMPVMPGLGATSRALTEGVPFALGMAPGMVAPFLPEGRLREAATTLAEGGQFLPTTLAAKGLGKVAAAEAKAAVAREAIPQNMGPRAAAIGEAGAAEAKQVAAQTFKGEVAMQAPIVAISVLHEAGLPLGESVLRALGVDEETAQRHGGTFELAVMMAGPRLAQWSAESGIPQNIARRAEGYYKAAKEAAGRVEPALAESMGNVPSRDGRYERGGAPIPRKPEPTPPVEGAPPVVLAPPQEVKAPAPVPEAAKGKEAWEMTQAEWGGKQAPAVGPISGKDVMAAYDKYGLNGDHYIAVRTAIATGKPVPPEVLADYPDLAAKVTPAAAPPPVTPPAPTPEAIPAPSRPAEALAPATIPPAAAKPSVEAPAKPVPPSIPTRTGWEDAPSSEIERAARSGNAHAQRELDWRQQQGEEAAQPTTVAVRPKPALSAPPPPRGLTEEQYQDWIATHGGGPGRIPGKTQRPEPLPTAAVRGPGTVRVEPREEPVSAGAVPGEARLTEGEKQAIETRRATAEAETQRKREEAKRRATQAEAETQTESQRQKLLREAESAVEATPAQREAERLVAEREAAKLRAEEKAKIPKPGEKLSPAQRNRIESDIAAKVKRGDIDAAKAKVEAFGKEQGGSVKKEWAQHVLDREIGVEGFGAEAPLKYQPPERGTEALRAAPVFEEADLARSEMESAVPVDSSMTPQERFKAYREAVNEENVGKANIFPDSDTATEFQRYVEETGQYTASTPYRNPKTGKYPIYYEKRPGTETVRTAAPTERTVYEVRAKEGAKPPSGRPPAKGPPTPPTAPQAGKTSPPPSRTFPQPPPKDIPPLTEPRVKAEVEQKIINVVEPTLLKQGLKRDPKIPLIDYVLDSFITEKITPQELADAFQKNGLTPEEFAGYMRGTAAFAGRTLQKLSVLQRKLNLLAETSPETANALEKATGLYKTLETSMPLNWYLRLGGVWKGMIVSRIATTIRNGITNVGRAGIDVIDQGMQRGLQAIYTKKTGKTPEIVADPGAAWVGFLDSMRGLTPSNKRRIAMQLESAMADVPLEWDRLTNTYMSEAKLKAQGTEVGSFFDPILKPAEKAADFVNFFNKWQDEAQGNVIAMAKLDAIARRKGTTFAKVAEEGRKDVFTPEDIKSAVDEALELTWRKAPKYGTFPYHTVQVAKSLWPVIPFARFTAQAIRFQYKFSPLGFLDLLSRSEREAIKRGDTKTISRGLIGSGLLVSAYALRQIYGSDERKWYELRMPGTGKVDPKTGKVDSKSGTWIDTRAYNPFAFYLFLADLAARKMNGTLYKVDAEQMAQALVGVNIKRGIGLSIVEQAFEGFADVQNPGAWDRGIKSFAGDIAGGYVTPLEQLGGLRSLVDSDAEIVRDAKEDAFLGPIKKRITGLEETLPEVYTPTRAGPMRSYGRGIRTLTGTGFMAPTNTYEQELNKFQMTKRDVLPTTGDGVADNIRAKHMGEIVERDIIPILEGDNYQRRTQAEKRGILVDLTSKARTKATKAAEKEEPERFATIKQGKKSEVEKAMRAERSRFDQIALVESGSARAELVSDVLDDYPVEQRQLVAERLVALKILDRRTLKAMQPEAKQEVAGVK